MADSHTVARTFLKSFAAKIDGQPLGLVVYNKHGDLEAQVREQSVVSAAEISKRVDYYAVVGVNGTMNSAIEDGLRNIEDHWPTLATALRAPGVIIDDGQLGTLAAIAGIWEARSPRTIDALRLQYDAKIEAERAALERDGLSGDALEAAVAAFVTGHFDAAFASTVAPTSSNWARAMIHDLGQANYDLLRHMRIAILTIQNPAHGRAVGFFTSDHPIAWLDPVDGGFLLCPNKIGPNVEVTFPVSKSKCLLFSFQSVVREVNVDDATVDVINARTVLCGLDEVYAPPAQNDADKARHLLSLRANNLRNFTALSPRFADSIKAAVDVLESARELGITDARAAATRERK
jgi:hypothetical protein